MEAFGESHILIIIRFISDLLRRPLTYARMHAPQYEVRKDG